ncbi:MAG: glycosyl transferase family 4 [Desulfurococcales archaeon]|nr:glycosyl transferase family 4 [Desulfurococcales archaeon]
MDYSYTDVIIASTISAAMTLGLVGGWIRTVFRDFERLKKSNEDDRLKVLIRLAMGRDMNKPHKPLAVRFGGVWVPIAIVFGVLILEAYHIYVLSTPYSLSEVMAVSTLLLLGVLVGLVDDLSVWRGGVSVRYRVAASFIIALPLSVVKAGQSTMSIPLIGKVDFGIFYSTLIVPIGVMGASNAFNILAGYNGLEAGMATIILSGYAAYALHHGHELALKLSLISIAALLAFLVYNWYPAKTFPGNGFTYAIGSLLAAVVIVGNFEKFGVMVFPLYFLELILFLRGLKNGIYKQNFGIPQPDGSLELPYDKIYSVTHLAIYTLKRLTGKATEKGVVALILGVQALITVLALIATW